MDKNLQTMIDNMPEKTGKSLEAWKKILGQKKIDKHSVAVNFLKQEHGVTHGFANTIVALFRKDEEPVVDLVQAQYHGKEVLIPLYDQLVGLISKFGSDIKIIPKKSSVSLVRKRQFALIKPATKTRIDLGLKLPDTPTDGRLGSSGPFGTMCTHRVKITDASEVDDELVEWLRTAYDRSV